MRKRAPIGHVGQLQIVVGNEHVIDFAEAGMPPVFSTPKMIGLIERTARHSLHEFLETNERTVGVEIDLQHLAPAAPGAAVTLTTRVIASEGPFVTFAVEARDDQELLARGIHKRAIIDVASFARRVARKSRRS
jgi:predicted thioesterase